MPTLRELSFAIEANTSGLQKAIPVLDALTKQMGVLATSIQKVAKNFESQSTKGVKAASAMGAAHASASDKIKASFAKQNNQVERARDKLTEMNKKLKELGREAGGAIGRNVQVFKRLEKSIRGGAASTSEFAKRMSNFDTQLIRANRSLMELGGGQRSLTSSTKGAQAALVRQTNAIAKNRERYLDLLAALEQTKSSEERIKSLKRAFIDLERKMKGGTLTTKKFSKAQNDFNAQLGKVRRSSNISSPALKAVADKMKDLSKSVQVALGPLSGVAARLTAFTALANRNTIAIAGVIAAVIAFGISMVKAIGIGSQYEKQLLRINAVLNATGHRAGLTATEVDNLAKEVGELTLTTQEAARGAATIFLTLRNASKEIAKDALLAAQGMALIGRGDIQSQMRRLSRILEDPINNLKSLSESAIFFDASQERLIRNLQESGDLLGAQKAVLERLKPVMEAATGEALGLAGAWDTFKETMTSFAQDASVAGGSVQVLASIIVDLTNRLKEINAGTDIAINLGTTYRLVIDGLAKIISFVANNMKLFIGTIIVFLGLRLISAVISMALNFKTLALGIWAAAQRLGLITAAVKGFVKLRVAVVALGAAIAAGISPPLIAVAAIIAVTVASLLLIPNALEKVIAGFKKFGSLASGVFKSVFGSDVVQNVKGFFDKIARNIGAWATNIVEMISKTFSNMFEKIFGDDELQKSVKKGMTAVRKLQIQMEKSFGQFQLPPQLETRFKLAFERIGKSFTDALVIGDVDDKEFMKKLKSRVSQITEILGKLPFGDDPSSARIEEIADALEKMGIELVKTTGFQSRFTIEQERALEAFSVLGKEMLGLENAQRSARNEMIRFKDVYDDMIAAVKITAGDLFPLTTQEVEKIKVALANTRDPIEKLITGIKNQTILQRLATSAALAQGESLSKLTVKHKLLSEQISSGITPVAELRNEFRKLLTPQQIEQVARMEKAFSELDTEVKKFSQTNFNTNLSDELKLREKQIQLVRSSSFQQELGLRLRQREIELSREAGKTNEALAKSNRNLITEGVTNEFVLQYDEIKNSLNEANHILETELSLLHLSEGARADAVFRAEAMLEIERKFAGIVDGRIDKEELLSEVLRERENERTVAHFREVRDLERRGELLQKEFDLLFATEERREFEISLLEKRQELMQRFDSLQDPRAKRELEIFRILQLQEIQLNDMRKLVDTLEGSFKSFFDSLVDGFAKGELTAISFKDTVVAALQEIAAALLKLAITDKLVDTLVAGLGAIGGNLFSQISLPGATQLPTGRSTTLSPIASGPSGVIPGLQHGGIIPRDDFIASLHKGEKVLPLDSEPLVNVEVVINDHRGSDAPDLQISQQMSGTMLRQIVIDIFAEDARSGGPASRAIGGTFGLRRHGRNR